MNDIQYNVQFEKLCNKLELGDMVEAPKAISGGLLHRMYAIETVKGKYAVKALNPKIMLRPMAVHHTIRGEEIAGVAAENIPTISAQKFNDSFIQKVDGQCYLLFKWVEGRSLKPNEINIDHCEKMGDILANLHLTDFSNLGIAKESVDSVQLTDWNCYLQRGKENNSVWVDLMDGVVDKLYEWNDETNKSAKLLSSFMIISHRDLDSKNVMWNVDNPIVIDWESAGYVNPMQELTETALYWSEDEEGNINKERFFAFIHGYKKRYGDLEANWREVLRNGFSGKLGWLEYSLKRSLRIECTDEREQQMGTQQVIGTINALKSYADMIPKLESWLNNE